MAEIVLKIPKEFEEDFNKDKFRECFMRVLFDCKAWRSEGYERGKRKGIGKIRTWNNVNRRKIKKREKNDRI